MKNLLLVDDETYKSQQILKCIQEKYSSIRVNTIDSLNKSLLEIRKNHYDIVLLDMSLPLYNKKESANFNSYAGMDFLAEINRKKISTPTIVITQYEILGEGSNQRTAESINQELTKLYSNYLGMIIYSATDTSWKEKLFEKIEGLL